MITGVRLWCEKCRQFTAHYADRVVDGGKAAVTERCAVCQHSGQAHEAPTDDAPTLAEAGIAHREPHLVYLRWLIARGYASDGGTEHRDTIRAHGRREMVADRVAALADAIRKGER